VSPRRGFARSGPWDMRKRPRFTMCARFVPDAFSGSGQISPESVFGSITRIAAAAPCPIVMVVARPRRSQSPASPTGVVGLPHTRHPAHSCAGAPPASVAADLYLWGRCVTFVVSTEPYLRAPDILIRRVPSAFPLPKRISLGQTAHPRRLCSTALPGSRIMFPRLR